MGRLSAVSTPVRRRAKGAHPRLKGGIRSAVGTSSPTSCRAARSPPPGAMPVPRAGPLHRAPPPLRSTITSPPGRLDLEADGSRTGPAHSTFRVFCGSRARGQSPDKDQRPPVSASTAVRVLHRKAQPGTRLIIVRLVRRNVACWSTAGRVRCSARILIMASPEPAAISGGRLESGQPGLST